MRKVASFNINRVLHPLCDECEHNLDCMSTCVAIEVLVKLAQASPEELQESVENVATWLDLENSFE